MSANRRSPRSVERLCGKLSLNPNMDTSGTALALGLAHLTGWSAERISNFLEDQTNVKISAEEVWSFYWRWILSHDSGNQDPIPEVETSVMRCLLKQAGIDIEVGMEGRPLNKTVQPITVNFVQRWSPRSTVPIALCDNYTPETREKIKAWLEKQTPRAYGHLTPTERPIVALFGSSVELLIKTSLRRWSREMNSRMVNRPLHCPVKEREQVDLIMEYLDTFQSSWESVFGAMERQHQNERSLGPIRNNEVWINSTGYGVKVLLGLMMADRVHVVDTLRRKKRESIGLEIIDTSSLDEESNTCYICYDKMGGPNGTSERPIKLVACCGQTYGEECLKIWLQMPEKGMRKTGCPHCRFAFSDAFLKKLFEGDERGSFLHRSAERSMSPQSELSEEYEAREDIIAGNVAGILAESPPVVTRVPLPSNSRQHGLNQIMERTALAAQQRRRTPSPVLQIETADEDDMLVRWGEEAQRSRTLSPPPVRRFDAQAQTMSQAEFFLAPGHSYPAGAVLNNSGVEREDDFAMEG